MIKKTGEKITNTIDFFKKDRVQQVLGLVFLVITLYLMIAFISHLTTWKTDQDQVLKPTDKFFFDSDVKVENSLGKFGAFIAHIFFYNWWGVSSFLVLIMTFTTGLNLLLRKNLFPLFRVYKICIFFLFWFSAALSFVFYSSGFPWGGMIGNNIIHVLTGLIGLIGTAILMVFAFISFLIVNYNISVYLSRINPLKAFQHPISPNVTSLKPEVKEEPIIEIKDDEPIPEEEPTHVPLFFNPENDMNTTEFEPVVSPVKEKLVPTGNISMEIEETAPEPAPVKESEIQHYDSTLDLSNYKYPTLDLLEEYANDKAKINTEELEKNKNQIIETLSNYNIKIEKIKATIGPTVTLYEIVPEAGTRISKIKNLEDDIALSLSALGIRIIAPIPGKGTIGIEVPNQKKEIVSMRSMLSSPKFAQSDMDLPIALGKSISNEIVIVDLAKMPHLLMAGATGQGKSVGLNAILVSLLYKKHPSQLKFVLIDPKKVELTLYKHIEKHFLAKLEGEDDPIITDNKKVINTLQSLCALMDDRYNLLKDAEVRNIKEYNQKFVERRLNPLKGHQYLPYIVLVIDEFADLIMTAGKEVEMPIARLAQLARAIGIHLVIATQRPSVNIITGTIKANFPARIAFKVSSKIDSRTILDAGGAEQLVGRGDMLLSAGGELIRLQCPFVDTPEVEKIADFIKGQQGYAHALELPKINDDSEDGGGGSFNANERDELFEEAARIIVQNQQGSTSLLQRKLQLGHNRAGRIIDQLEAARIVGKHEGSKAREVLFQDELQLEQFLQTLKNKNSPQGFN